MLLNFKQKMWYIYKSDSKNRNHFNEKRKERNYQKFKNKESLYYNKGICLLIY